jgi:hypothetical protein
VRRVAGWAVVRAKLCVFHAVAEHTPPYLTSSRPFPRFPEEAIQSSSEDEAKPAKEQPSEGDSDAEIEGNKPAKKTKERTGRAPRAAAAAEIVKDFSESDNEQQVSDGLVC